METYQAAAILVAGVLAADALIHTYWLTGRVWPAHDVRSLSHAVLGADVPFTPRVLVPLIAVLLAGTVGVLGRADLLGLGAPSWIWAASTAAVAVGLVLRGVAGIVWALTKPRNTWFYRLNAIAYTPACWLLFVATTIVWRRG